MSLKVNEMYHVHFLPMSVCLYQYIENGRQISVPYKQMLENGLYIVSLLHSLLKTAYSMIICDQWQQLQCMYENNAVN